MQLGILPDLAELIARQNFRVKNCTDLILTGKTISSQNALKIGLVDKLYSQKILISETIKFLNGILLKIVSVRKGAFHH